VRRLLIVDDEPGVAEAFRQYVGKALWDGWVVSVEHTGTGALERIAAGAVDVCMVDYYLGDMTAPELVRAALDVVPALRGRFIVCTGAVLDPRHELFTELGCRRLDKPFDLSDLLATVEEAIGG
jgi:CheY-like chemotaxis protein